MAVHVPIAPIATWAFNLGALFMAEQFHRSISFRALAPGVPALWWLDRHQGVYRWYLSYNLVLLRCISFNMDRFWAAKSGAAGDCNPAKDGVAAVGGGIGVGDAGGEAASGGRTVVTYRWHERTSRAGPDYCLPHFLAYVFYVPLYLAGPTITFNAWMSQVASSGSSIVCGG